MLIALEQLVAQRLSMDAPAPEALWDFLQKYIPRPHPHRLFRLTRGGPGNLYSLHLPYVIPIRVIALNHSSRVYSGDSQT